jgi:glycosyltransferase involved in cell wall biosynthesis/GT2 family glycosyltransferase
LPDLILAAMGGVVCLGVAVHAEPTRLADTVRFLRAYTDPEVRLVLLPDGPDEPTAAALATDPDLSAMEQWATPDTRGMAACFNRLATRSRANVVVLLESGALVGPRWLTLLLAALDRPGCGLAGPSTNTCSNEQGIQPRARGDDRSVRRDAAEAARRFGTAARTLEPLYRLADFCYAVRREVIDAIGQAEEAYGLGPCWELDYNIRAARAGFRGVWVGASYVYRSPPTARRQLAEVVRLEANRRLYQDRFCGLRLCGETTEYRPDCVGDACPHFAPDTTTTQAKPARGATDAGPAADVGIPPATVSHAVVASPPLVTCIMPTRGRPEFALQSVRYFQRQDYPSKELVIVEDGASRLAALLPPDPRIRLVASELPRTLGALRNTACQHARGEIIVQWDDDDWYGPHRVSRQVAAIRSGEADITALRDATFFDLERWRFWRCTPQTHRQIFVRDVHGGTLTFRRSVWERLARYPDRSLAEDAALLDLAVRRGARLCALSADGLYVYLRHGANSWRLAVGTRPGWEPRGEPDLPPEDRAFYARRCPSAPAPPAAGPLVSCIMPTLDRRRFVPQAIEYFRRQDYPAKELVIVDDGRDSVVDLVPDDPTIVYRRLETRVLLGVKRNVACEIARGSVIVHWDDDDWYAPNRLSTQLARLMGSGSDLCGCRSLRFYDPAAARAWRYEWSGSRRIWAAGASLCYSKDAWKRSPFPDVATGEDTRFVWGRGVRSVCDVSETDTLVAIIHGGNTVPKMVHGANWSGCRPAKLIACSDRTWRSTEDLCGSHDRCAPSFGPGRAHDQPQSHQRLRVVVQRRDCLDVAEFAASGGVRRAARPAGTAREGQRHTVAAVLGGPRQCQPALRAVARPGAGWGAAPGGVEHPCMAQPAHRG